MSQLRVTYALCALLCLPTVAFAQANGALQIHYMDVGQGDGAVLISPLGQVVLFDNGVLNQCAKPVGYLQALGVTTTADHCFDDGTSCRPSTTAPCIGGIVTPAAASCRHTSKFRSLLNVPAVFRCSVLHTWS